MPDSAPPPRISVLGNQVIEEIAERFKVEKRIVIRACLVVALMHQSELSEAIEELRRGGGVNEEEDDDAGHVQAHS